MFEATSRHDPGPAISFRYFKGFAEAELPLDQPVTLLLGRNGAGKSNVIEGVHLLSELGQGLPLQEVGEPGEGRRCEVRGGLRGCASLREEWFVLGARGRGFRYELVLRPKALQIESESLREGDALLFETVEKRSNFSRGLFPVRYRAPGTDQMAESTFPTSRTVLAGYPRFVGRPPAAEPALFDRLERWRAQLTSCWVLAPRPEEMRRYERVGLGITRSQLKRNGSNLSVVLYEMEQGSEEDRKTLATIRELVSRLPEEPLGRLDFLVNNEAADVMLAFALGDDGPRLDARLLSDGTLRYLAIVTALETLPEGALVLLEDFDAGLHPSRVAELVRHLWRRCSERGLRALVTTHNPTVLDSLDPAQLAGVVVCYRDPVTRSAKLLPLLKIADADLLLVRGSLGDLVTRGVLEQHLLPTFATERRQAALNWLKSLP